MAGKFEVYHDKGGKFRFRPKAGNGEIVASGEAYETKAAAKPYSAPPATRKTSKPTADCRDTRRDQDVRSETAAQERATQRLRRSKPPKCRHRAMVAARLGIDPLREAEDARARSPTTTRAVHDHRSRPRTGQRQVRDDLSAPVRRRRGGREYQSDNHEQREKKAGCALRAHDGNSSR
ncbi:DUF1508 domain-containing protein [Amycolatopsis sp. M39]|uniref:DUF1508 domain-containing protein n=1 Tax=Amycolatopsis TaxID=1813 RepID=UPI001E3FA6F6|nr:DUF1508 domain-containing protein [Amycolatopsis sp. M39]